MTYVKITGVITKDLTEKTNSEGNTYYYTFLERENYEKDLPIFFWKVNSEEITKLEELEEGTEIIVEGNYGRNNDEIFNVKKWEIKEEGNDQDTSFNRNNENNILELHVNRKWGNRTLPVDSKEWRELRQRVLERDDYKCRFCGIELTKYLICDHISGDASNNSMENLGINCPSCDEIRHCGRSGIKGRLIIKKSMLEQVEIVRRTHDFYLVNKRNPLPEDVDSNCKPVQGSCFNVSGETVLYLGAEGEVSSHYVANLLLEYDREEIEGIEQVRGFFTSQFSLEFLTWKVREQQLQARVEVPPKF